ncbi:MAG: DUF1326 domain-containing protein [Gammaproteobacteria bacterium]|uniref:DUF1326 domain-containing protein n=1 Tax=Bradyrhizobium sp. TaxID=376 RepID=UPI003D0EB535
MNNGGWKMCGEYVENCNCERRCPCRYTNPQSEITCDHCTALLGLRIDEGSHGDVDLPGLKFAPVIRAGSIRSDGGWISDVIVNETAADAQRAPLAAGEAEGMPAKVCENPVSDRRLSLRRLQHRPPGVHAPRTRDLRADATALLRAGHGHRARRQRWSLRSVRLDRLSACATRRMTR